jgi:hypothetical protein
MVSQRGSSVQVHRPDFLHILLISSEHVTCPAHFIVLNFIACKVFGEDFELWNHCYIIFLRKLCFFYYNKKCSTRSCTEMVYNHWYITRQTTAVIISNWGKPRESSIRRVGVAWHSKGAALEWKHCCLSHLAWSSSPEGIRKEWSSRVCSKCEYYTTNTRNTTMLPACYRPMVSNLRPRTPGVWRSILEGLPCYKCPK